MRVCRVVKLVKRLFLKGMKKADFDFPLHTWYYRPKMVASEVFGPQMSVRCGFHAPQVGPVGASSQRNTRLDTTFRRAAVTVVTIANFADFPVKMAADRPLSVAAAAAACER